MSNVWERYKPVNRLRRVEQNKPFDPYTSFIAYGGAAASALVTTAYVNVNDWVTSYWAPPRRRRPDEIVPYRSREDFDPYHDTPDSFKSRANSTRSPFQVFAAYPPPG